MDKKKGEFAVNLARQAMEFWLKNNRTLSNPAEFPEDFKTMRGVFTTIHTHPDGKLRGCIGYPYPTLPLIMGIIRSATEVTRDPRFPPLEEEDLDRIIVEVSILTEPEEIEAKDPAEYFEKIELGKDGLIIKKDFQNGLLLPQVPGEQGWDIKAYLENLCWKAGLDPESWKSKDTQILKFRAEIFSETEPKGKINKV